MNRTDAARYDVRVIRSRDPSSFTWRRSGFGAASWRFEGFLSCPLNIASMRSVIRNPAVTFVIAQTTATNPRIVERRPYCPPAATIAPTSEMPEIAFVADISGVWQKGRHALDDDEADERRRE